eukprot:1194535-Prorocentrum_minimum.AAC.2
MDLILVFIVNRESTGKGLWGVECTLAVIGPGGPVRLYGQRYRWCVPDIADLLVELRRDSGTDDGDDGWDVGDLGKLAGEAVRGGLEGAVAAELVAEFPRAWDTGSVADMLGGSELGPGDPLGASFDLLGPPSEPHSTPSEPLLTPLEPLLTPSEPLLTRSEPHLTPSEPHLTPSEPLLTPLDPP